MKVRATLNMQVKSRYYQQGIITQEGIITSVTHRQWAAPIVAIPKKDGKFKICGNYKVTVNQSLSVEEYPEIFATLYRGKVFSSLLTVAC